MTKITHELIVRGNDKIIEYGILLAIDNISRELKQYVEDSNVQKKNKL